MRRQDATDVGHRPCAALAARAARCATLMAVFCAFLHNRTRMAADASYADSASFTACLAAASPLTAAQAAQRAA